ncbi:MAG TPA: hypothetical protein V6D47_00560 [Oscillatoriaceae cyanobacterium]
MKRVFFSLTGTLVALFLMQAGATPATTRTISGPSQGALPQPSASTTPGGGGGPVTRAAPRHGPMIMPVAPVHPHGVDAIATPSAGGGGGAATPDLQSPARNPGNDVTPEQAGRVSPSSTQNASPPGRP